MTAQRKNWLSLMVCIVCLLALSATSHLVIMEAAVGEDVCLPCHVQHEGEVKLRSPTVNWQRQRLGNDEIVHSYHDNKSHPEYQAENFKGRTDFCSEELLGGNVSVRLKNVTLADFGNYSCHAALYVNTLQTEQSVMLKQKSNTGANSPGESKTLLIIGVTLFALVISAGLFVWYLVAKRKFCNLKELPLAVDKDNPPMGQDLEMLPVAEDRVELPELLPPAEMELPDLSPLDEMEDFCSLPLDYYPKDSAEEPEQLLLGEGEGSGPRELSLRHPG